MHAVNVTRDLREGGSWSLVQQTKNDLIYGLASAALFFARGAGRESLASFGRGLGAFVHALAWPLRDLARRNVRVAFPDASSREVSRIVGEAFENLGENLGHAVASLETAPPLLPFEEPSRAILRDALAEGRGVVLPSAHLGPWERLAATLVGAGFPLTAIVRESYDPRFDRIVDSARERGGVATIARGAPGAATRIVRALRSGRVLGIPMDLRTRAESVTVPLLGGSAPTPIGPARIALRTGAPVVVCTVEPDPSGALAVTCTRVDAKLTSAEELTARINEELGRRIRLAPEHWLWMHDRFTV